MKENKRSSFTLEEKHASQLRDIEQEIKTFTNLRTQSSFIRFMLEKINSGEYDFLSPKEEEAQDVSMYLVDKELFNTTKEQAKKQNYATAKELIVDVLEYEHKKMENGEIPFSPKG